jgi:hypothetical protein
MILLPTPVGWIFLSELDLLDGEGIVLVRYSRQHPSIVGGVFAVLVNMHYLYVMSKVFCSQGFFNKN